MANPSDTPLQAQVRATIALPDNIPWSDAAVRAYLSSRGFPSDLADKAIQTATGAATGAQGILDMTPIRPAGPAAPSTGRLRPVDPNQPANQSGQWVDTQTGQIYTGQLASNDPTQLVVGFSGGNPQNTTSYNINTGQKIEADPHPWLDALKNAGIIFGPSLGAGALAGAFGGAGAASAASGGSAAATPTLAGAGIPGLAYGGAGSFGAGAGTAAAGAGTAAATGAAGAGTAAATGAASAGGWADILKKVLPAAAGITTAALTKPSLAPGQQELNQSIAALVPYLEQLLKTQVARQTAQGPLNDQVLRMAMGQLPNWTKGGG